MPENIPVSHSSGGISMETKFKKKGSELLAARVAAVVGGAALVLFAAPASAVKIDVGNSDINMRFDNTVKYNIGWRVDGREKKIADNYLSQATNYGWDRGDIVTNRIDLLSEFDFVYKENWGFRISGAAWYDDAFDNKVKGNPAYQAAGMGTMYADNRFTKDVKKWYRGSGELLDAFVFGRVDYGSVPVNFRIGRHSLYWGEALFSFNGIAYGQGPLDLRKATSTPGTEAKELFLPQNQISAAAQITDNINVAAFYGLEWDPHRLPEGGTYLGGADISFLGGQPGFVGNLHSGPYRVPDNSGNWGINTSIKVDSIASTIGVYYRRFDDRYPYMLAAPVGMYNAYARDVKLYGVSISHLIGSVATSFEVSKREHTGLQSAGGIAYGDTWQAIASAIAYFGKTPIFDSAAVTAEINYAKLDSVDSSTRQFFNKSGTKYANCQGGYKMGCASDSSWGLNLAITPTYFQVFPGVDLNVPINYSLGLKGNTPTPLGTGKGAGAWSIGAEFDIHAQYKVTLTYADYFGKLATIPNPNAMPGASDTIWPTAANGSGPLRDRGWVSLTFKTTF
jgi:hypothetical protein